MMKPAILDPITPQDMPRDPDVAWESLATLERISDELERDIATAVERDQDERKRSISKSVLGLFGYGAC
jgi:hypothetical protein